MKLQLQGLGINVAGRTLIRPLNLELEAGQCWAVLGPNGAGKTSLLHTLAGLRAVDTGQVLLDNQPLANLKPRARAQAIGLLLQQQQEQFPCTVLESVLIGRHPHLPPWALEAETDRQQARQALTRVDLAGLEHRTVASLSGGELQRMALARLLVQDSPILLLDEPSNHLDVRHQGQSLQIMQGLAQAGRLVVMALHDINLALRYCDHVLLLMPEGEALAGPVDILLTEANASKLYQHPLRMMEQDGMRLFYAAATTQE